MLRLERSARLGRRAVAMLRRPSRSMCTPAETKPKPTESGASGASQPIQGSMTWRMLAATVALGTGGLAYYSMEHERRMKQITSSKTIGKAAIGGPFSVIDANDQAFTEEDLLGHWSLVYFGFTMCPDICPAELTKLGEALELVEKRGRKIGRNGKDQVLPIFVSIDPERDSSKRSQEYASEFHSGFIGLSGPLDNVKAMAKKYRVYYSKDESGDDDYLVDHSIITFLMDPNGEFQEFYTKSSTAVEIASRMEAKMLAWKDGR